MEKSTKRKIWGEFSVGRDNESLVQKNVDQGTVGTFIHGHGKTFGGNNDGTLMKGVIKYFILGHPGGGRGVEENINVKRSSISHSKYLLRGTSFLVAPIDKVIKTL